MRLILSSLLGVALLSSVAFAAPDTDLVGVYAAEGTNPDGSPYTALVEIVKLDATYLVRWTQSNNEEVVGVGIEREGLLAVSYYGGSPAIVVYAVAADGRLDGQWTMGGAEGSVFKETLTKMPKGQQQPKRQKPASRPASHPGTISI